MDALLAQCPIEHFSLQALTRIAGPNLSISETRHYSTYYMFASAISDRPDSVSMIDTASNQIPPEH
jgi:tRNA isopentenyl-2-thiomethyl-A-37 hydroxylase MiaE